MAGSQLQTNLVSFGTGSARRSYRLAREENAGKLGGRRWQEELVPVGSTVEPREDVKPGGA
ncbi:MAG TPA: hypothetical protein VEI97_15680, partial [bacterium]|nr:hypothetical protein [bacterium]